MGTAAMLAGGLLGQFLVTLAGVPASTKYGIETVVSTRPQLGVRGSNIALGVVFCTTLGWNIVLMIFFGRAMASVLELLGLLDSSSKPLVSTVLSVAGVVFVWFLVSRGASSLKQAGPVIAVVITLMAVYLFILLVKNHGIDAIFAAQPLAPTDRLVNYTTGIEILLVSTLGWWTYMGGIVRMVSTGRKAILPSMIGLGVAWVIVGLVSLYSALVTGEADPTVWAPQVAGPVGGIFVLLFIAVANIGSTLVGAYIATLGISQISKVRKKLPWRAIAALTMLPMALVLILFPEPFYDRVGIFMAFIGIMVAPLIGIQIADWFYLKRLKNLKISSLYQEGSRSVYWYWHGFNPAGILALVVGSMTYMAILDPVLFTPRSWLFGYLTASLPCVLVSAFVYAVLSRAMFERDIRKKSVGGGG